MTYGDDLLVEADSICVALGVEPGQYDAALVILESQSFGQLSASTPPTSQPTIQAPLPYGVEESEHAHLLRQS